MNATASPVTAGAVVRDSYGNPARVVLVNDRGVHVVQLAGSDHGRLETLPAAGVRVVTDPDALAWAARRFAEVPESNRRQVRHLLSLAAR